MTTDYVYGGARALVHLHDRHLRSFVETWKRAAAADLAMPPTEDGDCAALDAMLQHVLGAARGYMVWMCEVLDLEAPGIDPLPDDLPAGLDRYLAHLLERWDLPLRGLAEEEADRPTYASRWGTEYCIDAMLEHAVMHPIRHQLQLDRLLPAS